MKRNLLSIIILALLVINLVLTSIMMATVGSASRKTAALVTDVADVLKLELSEGVDAEDVKTVVPMENIEVYKIPDQMTIPLTYGADVSTKESLITGEIYDIIGSYTLEDAQANKELMREDILKRIQEMFDSDFIFQVSFSDIIFQ